MSLCPSNAPGQARPRRIYQKIGFGYFVAIGIGWAGSMIGMVVADYFQGQSVAQLLDAQVQSQLLSDFEQTADQIQLHSIRAVAISSSADARQEIIHVQTKLARAQQIQQEIMSFLANDPAWLVGDPNTINQLLTTYTNTLTRQFITVKAAIATNPRSASSEILSAASMAELEGSTTQLSTFVYVARQQELSAAEAMETAQGFEKFMIVSSMLLASAIAGLLAWRSTQAIARPIETLTHVAQRVALDADYTLRVPVTTDDEVGILAQSLNHLITQVAAHTQDLTTSAQVAEQQAQELTKTLETLQYAQSQLIQAEKMSSLGQLAAGMAHEINNPITFIHGNIEYAHTYAQTLFDVVEQLLALVPELPSDVQDYLQQVELDFIRQDFPKVLLSLKRGVERINSLMLSLRVFSRLQEAQLKKVDLHEGIESTLMLLAHRLNAQPRRPEIVINCQFGTIPLVECYASQINQVFMNILTNAIDAIDDRWLQSPNYGQPTITINTACPSSGQVRVQISNNGVKIPDSAQHRLFDPFFSTKPVGKGVGLGLSICYDVVFEKHHGSITYQSPVADSKDGAQFTIDLPIYHSPFLNK